MGAAQWNTLLPFLGLIGCICIVVVAYKWLKPPKIEHFVDTFEGFSSTFHAPPAMFKRRETTAPVVKETTTSTTLTADEAALLMINDIYGECPEKDIVSCPGNPGSKCCRDSNPLIGFTKEDARYPSFPPRDRFADKYILTEAARANDPIQKSEALILAAYDAYQDAEDAAELEITEAAKANLDVVEVQDPELPDWGQSLGAFDMDVTAIPWDADNRALIPKDTIWGAVGKEASRSIFKKVYHQELFKDPNNIIMNEGKPPLYHSVDFGCDINDPNAVAAVQNAEFLYQNAVAPMIGNYLQAELFGQPSYEFSFKNGVTRAEAFDPEKDPPIRKRLRAFGAHLKGKVGPKLKGLRGKIKIKFLPGMQKQFQRFFTKYIIKSISSKAVTSGISAAADATAASLSSAAAAAPPLAPAAAAAAVYAGTCKTIAIAVTVVTTIWDTLFPVIQGALAPILEKTLDGEGFCGPGWKTIPEAIPGWANQIIQNTLPIIGDVVGLMEPYVCFQEKPDLAAARAEAQRAAEQALNNIQSLIDAIVDNIESAAGDIVNIHSLVTKVAEERKTMPGSIAGKPVSDVGKDILAVGKTLGNQASTIGLAALQGMELAAAQMAEGIVKGFAGMGIKVKETPKQPAWYEDTTISLAYSDKKIDIPTDERVFAKMMNGGIKLYKIEDLSGWCNYGNPVMLDRMANFYYKNSLGNLAQNEDGTVAYEFISKFYGVVASSELSCDVQCEITRVTYDPIVGDRIKVEQLKEPTIGPDGQEHDDISGTPIARKDRRFYFYKAKDDPEGLFTVSACTYVDGAAPAALQSSSEPDGEYVPSLPKRFAVKAKEKNWAGLAKSLAISCAHGAIMGRAGQKIGDMGGKAGGEIGGILAGTLFAAGQGAEQEFFSSELEKLDKSLGVIAPDREMENFVTGSRGAGYILVYSDDFYFIDKGPIVEQAAGYIPEIPFGSYAKITYDECRDKRRLKAAIDKYHAEYPKIRVKRVDVIEPRGITGCYFEWQETSYDPDTNLEGETTTLKRIILDHELMDPWTGVYRPTRFVTENIDRDFPVRTIPIPAEFQKPYPGTTIMQDIKYPTRKPVKNTAGDAVKDSRGIPLMIPIYPIKPFIVPRALPSKRTNLGGTACPATTTCDTKLQIQQLTSDFNNEHSDRKIQKVLKAWTPATDRCDYEVEMLRIVPETGAKVVAKESVTITVQPTQTNQCIFKWKSDGSSLLNSGTFIQPNTPFLYSDASGGIFGYDSVLQIVRNTINAGIASIIQLNPLKILQPPIDDSKSRTDKLFETVFNNQTLRGCPDTKCSDPAILNRFVARFNNDRFPGQQFGVEKHYINQVLKAGVASPSQCDFLVSEGVEYYDDILGPPSTDTPPYLKGASYRVNLKDTGGCNWIVDASSNAIFDVSSNAVGIRSDATTLTPAYNPPTCSVNCRDDSILRAIKSYLEQQNNGNGVLNSYKQVVQSFQRSPTSCEYKILKDYRETNPVNGKVTTDTNIETYATANFSVTQAGSTCNFALSSATEFDTDNIGEDTDPATEETFYTLNGRRVELPILFNYDDTTRSPKVNLAIKNFPI